MHFDYVRVQNQVVVWRFGSGLSVEYIFLFAVRKMSKLRGSDELLMYYTLNKI